MSTSEYIQWRPEDDVLDLAEGMQIITSAENLADARRRFVGHVIFTPETAQGLEFEKVVLWRLFDEQALMVFANQLSSAKTSPLIPSSPPKTSQLFGFIGCLDISHHAS